MKAEDKFTSFLKVGLVVDSKTNGYVVSQKIVAGTALDETKRTSDYYILIHPDYSEGYGKVNKINLGHKINVNKQFPDSSIDSLNATISVVGISSESDYYISLKGTNTLPSPQKAGYKFVGWYLEKEFINKVTEVKESTTVYARWVQDQGDIMTENILNCVSDIATSDTIDELVLENDDATIYTIIGDGELEEGQNWEAAEFASIQKLDNLIVFLDNNEMQIDDYAYNLVYTGSYVDKWNSFGFDTYEVDGHDHEAIYNAIVKAKETKGKPHIIILNTIKGKGVSFIEEAKVGNHSMPISKEQLETALKELGLGDK